VNELFFWPLPLAFCHFRRAQKQENTEGYYGISDTDRMTNVFGGVEPKESKLKIL
jgi:hypothetical protein